MDRQRYRDQLDTLRQAPPRHAALTDDAFVLFTTHDYGRRRRLHPDVAWEDACRAYAFAAASHAQHRGHLDLDTEIALEDDWDRVRGDAGPEWPVARTLLREAWRWLDEHGPADARTH